MSNSQHAALQRALSIRLNLQISLSALPIVEEWMDIHLTRWLESIPLPPEMPSGHNAHFTVRVASDLSRLSWDAYGNPAGFIPKLAKYMEAVKMSKEDMALIDEMGNGLEPKLVGSWIAVADGGITTGWQFCDEHPFARIEPLFAEHEGKAQLMSWLSRVNLERFGRFVQTIGDKPASLIEFPLQGVAIDDRLDAAEQAFSIMAGTSMPTAVRDAMSNAAVVNLAVAVQIQAGQITAVGVSAPGLGNDVVAKLCQDLGLRFDDKHVRLQGAFGADGADRVEYTRVLGGAARDLVDLVMLPSGNEAPRAPDESN